MLYFIHLIYSITLSFSKSFTIITLFQSQAQLSTGETFSNLRVIFLHFFPGKLPVNRPARFYQIEKGTNLTLLLHITQLITNLDQIVNIILQILKGGFFSYVN